METAKYISPDAIQFSSPHHHLPNPSNCPSNPSLEILRRGKKKSPYAQADQRPVNPKKPLGREHHRPRAGNKNRSGPP